MQDAPLSDFTSEGSSQLFVHWPEHYELDELDSSGVTARYDQLTYLETSDIEEDEPGSSKLPGDDPQFDVDHYQYTNLQTVNSSPLPLDVPLAYRNCDPHEPDENSPDPFRIDFARPTRTTYSITHPSTPIRILYLIAIWLHSFHHVAF